MKQTKPNKGEGQKHGWCNAVAKADREVDEESNIWNIPVCARLYVLILAGKCHQTRFETDGRRDREKDTTA